MAATHPKPAEEAFPISLVGRDEMNLAELPIALLADRIPKGQKTLYFEDKHGRLTITGSDAYGLPTAVDSDVIVALIYLTKQRNNFTDVKVNFSRYELIKLLNWPDDGGFYKRLDQSFNRWTGVMMVYDKCWWDNKTKKYVSAKMHILESVVIAEPGGKNLSGQSDLPFSTFTWNKTFIESCQADNLRQLNLDTYFSLKSAISKRLYRFLGKRFYQQSDCTFDLNEIAFDRVGLSRNYERNAGKIKEKLQPAIDELETIGFLRPLNRDDRYRRIDRGQWTIRLTRQSPALIASPLTLPAAPPPLVMELAKRGVSDKTAADLVAKHPAETIRLKIEVFDWLVEKQDKRVAKSPEGYLVKSITDDYKTPKGFTSAADRQKRQEATRQQQQADTEERRRKQEVDAQARREKELISGYWDSLSKEQQAAHDDGAIAQADAEALKLIEPGPMKRFGMTLLRDGYTRKLLEAQGKLPPSGA